jgi:hypothetical protein
MKRILAIAAGGAVLAALAAAGCAHGNGSESKAAVRVVTNAQDVAGCEKLSQVRLQGTWTASAAKEELEKLVQSKGGNVLLIGSATTTSNSGTAYRCSGGASSGTP